MPSKTKTAATAGTALPSIPRELIDHFVTGPMSAETIQDISFAFRKALIERALGGELTHHLGYPPGADKPDDASNHRNGSTAKTVLTGDGKMRIATPRDRECVREDALSAGCKSPSGLVATQQSKVTALPRGGVGSNRR